MTTPEEEQETLAHRYSWKKIHAPRTWSPKAIGAELIGFYGGRTTRQGVYGQYDVVLVHVPQRGSYMVSGCQILQLIDASMIEVGGPIRIRFGGHQALSDNKAMKIFELFVAELPVEESTDIPIVQVEPQ